MRKVLRAEANEDYWDRRWTESGADHARFEDLTIYPIAYAEIAMASADGPAIDIGCGPGRIVQHYHRQGRDIQGIERSQPAVAAALSRTPDLPVIQGDATDLPFDDASFAVAMAFGLFHNLETLMDDALNEFTRVLRPGGTFCISMRPDNLEMRLNETYWRSRAPEGATHDQFHKWLVTPGEFREKLASKGLRTDSVHRARNMSILYRVPALRASASDEAQRRSQGYRLNGVGAALDGVLTTVAPSQFCNVLVFLGTRG